MVDKKQRKVLDDAIDRFGGTLQILMAIEEMSELTKELVKNMRHGDNHASIADEVADVLIMMEQVMMLFGIEDTVKSNIDYKVNRLKERINGQ